jgi:hypothetical protein
MLHCCVQTACRRLFETISAQRGRRLLSLRRHRLRQPTLQARPIVPLRARILNKKVNTCRRLPPDIQVSAQVRRAKSTVCYTNSCHIACISRYYSDALDARSRLSLSTFTRLLRDALSGATFLVGSFSGTLYCLDRGSMDLIKKMHPDLCHRITKSHS